MLESPLLPITARPGIHLLGAYVASISRLRVKNTSWARIYLYGTYVAMGWLAPKYDCHSIRRAGAASVQFIPQGWSDSLSGIALVGHTHLAWDTRGNSLGNIRLYRIRRD